MKQLFYNLVLVFFVFAASVTMQSCTKDADDDPNCDNQIQNYYFDDKEKAQLLFMNTNFFSMRNSAGDSIFYLQSIKNTFTTYKFQRYVNPACGNKGTDIYYEAFNTTYKCNNQDSIEMKVYKETFSVSIHIRNTNFNFIYWDLSNKNYEFLKLFDSLEIRGKMYFLVNEIVSSTDTLYINKNEGVLKIVLTQPYLKLERL